MTAMFACALSMAMWAVAALVARQRKARLWFVPAWIAASLAAPAFTAAFTAIRIHTTVSGLAAQFGMESFGAAGIYTDTRPLLFVLYFATAMALVSVLEALRTAGDEEGEGRGGWAAAFCAALMIMLWGAVFGLLHETMGWIMRILAPASAPLTPSATINDILIAGIGVSAVALCVSIVLFVIFIAASREHPPAESAGRVLVLLAVLTFLVLLGSAIWLHGQTSALYAMAMGGNVR